MCRVVHLCYNFISTASTIKGGDSFTQYYNNIVRLDPVWVGMDLVERVAYI